MEASIQQLEKSRKKVVTLLIISITISIIAILIGLFQFLALDWQLQTYYFVGLLGSVLLIDLGLITSFFKNYSKYKRNFKATPVKVPFEKTFGQVIYSDTPDSFQQVIKNNDLMKMGNISSSDNYVKSCFKEVSFERADITVKNKDRSGGKAHSNTDLHGQWIVFEFNRELTSGMQIISQKDSSAQKKNTFFTDAEEGRHKVELEDIDFNEKFKVFCKDEHEALNTLTPHLIEVLRIMYDLLDDSFMLGFVDHHLHVAINNDTVALKPKLFGKLNLSAHIADIQREIDIIIGIIEGMTPDLDVLATAEDTEHQDVRMVI